MIRLSPNSLKQFTSLVTFPVDPCQHGVENVASDIVEINVDAIGTMRFEALVHGLEQQRTTRTKITGH